MPLEANSPPHYRENLDANPTFPDARNHLTVTSDLENDFSTRNRRCLSTFERLPFLGHLPWKRFFEKCARSRRDAPSLDRRGATR